MRQLIKIVGMSLLPLGITYLVLLICGWESLFYFIVLPSLLISAAAVYLTSLGCRLAKELGRESKWYFGLLGAVVAGSLGACFICMADSLQYGGWGKSDPIAFFLLICGSGSVFGLLPAVLVARRYRAGFGDVANAR